MKIDALKYSAFSSAKRMKYLVSNALQTRGFELSEELLYRAKNGRKEIGKWKKTVSDRNRNIIP